MPVTRGLGHRAGPAPPDEQVGRRAEPLDRALVADHLVEHARRRRRAGAGGPSRGSGPRPPGAGPAPRSAGMVGGEVGHDGRVERPPSRASHR